MRTLRSVLPVNTAATTDAHRPRAGRQGFARAALPNPHLQMMPVDDLHELGVRAPGKQGVMLKLRPDTG